MAITITSAGIFGVLGYKVLVECDLSQGLPSFDVVGLPDTSVKESRERVRSAIKNYGFEYPISKITVNLAPADIKKEGTVYDLPILMAILAKSKQINKIEENIAFVGELSLSGDIRSVSGVLSMTMALKEQGVMEFFVPKLNAEEASLCDGITVYPVCNIKEVVDHINGKKQIKPFKSEGILQQNISEFDFCDVLGQENAKRALEIAAAGMHNILMSGTPGSGKSMMAKAFTSILPPLTKEEILEVVKVRSVSGLTKKDEKFSVSVPFRAPHHTVSAIALTGGIGTNKFPKAGEISLAHKGILFLDELPEFSKDAIDALRAPIEDKRVTISRVNVSVTYPSEFVLVCAMNPCKCGYFGDESAKCSCSYDSVKRYNSKISGPILDRIDLFVNVLPVKFLELSERKKAESSADILKRVVKAREMQQKRFKDTNIKYNSGITPDKMDKFCKIDESGKILMEQAFKRLSLTARSYDRVLKLARTIADLDGNEEITASNIAEAIQYRRNET